MRYEFTPAAERALTTAAGWTSCADNDELHVPEVLLGLLAEPECRSALILARYGIDNSAVLARLPDMREVQPGSPDRLSRFSRSWLACLETAERRLIDYPQPLCLATEHLLLGIVATPSDVSAWLAERGLLADELEAEVHRLSGHESGPLPWNADDDLQHAHASVSMAPSANLASGLTIGMDQTEGEVSEQDQIGALRVIDAAANRCGEGLRVVEDYLRFVLDDRHLTTLCKNIRHELTAALELIAAEDRHAARETLSDVGTDVSLPAEQTRGTTTAVLQANFKRVEQSLRSLEEFSKTLSPATALALERLRYRVYTLERATDITRTSLERLADSRLYVLIDAGSSPAAFQQLVEALLAGGVSVIQLRDKQLADRELLSRACLLRSLTAGSQTLFIMNDRPDLAVLAGADGVHVGQEELTVKDARRILGPRGLIGVSTHSLEQARAAVLDGANYIGVGPTFPSDTKRFESFTGCELLKTVASEIRLPAFAIGGITPANLSQVLAAGCTRVAVSGSIVAAPDPARAAREFLSALRTY